MSAHSASALVSLLAKAGVAMLKFLTVVWVGSAQKYQPERHYMRGPGPKWREKQGLDRSPRSVV